MSLVARDGKNNLSPFGGHSGRGGRGKRNYLRKIIKLFFPFPPLTSTSTLKFISS